MLLSATDGASARRVQFPGASPVALMQEQGQFSEPSDKFFARGNGAGHTGSVDSLAEPMISPAITWAKYLGGSSYDYASGIAVDHEGNVLVTGTTGSSDLPGANNAHHGTGPYGADDVFLAKFTADGTLLWSTYIGGSGTDEGNGIAVDGAGNALVTGVTYSPDFAGRYGATDGDAFVAKVSSAGALIWATRLGGTSTESGFGIATDSSGNALVTGYVTSASLTSANNSYYGGQDAFVAKLNGTGSELWTTYLGGSGAETGWGIAVDTNGDPFVAGQTTSNDFAGANDSFHGDPYYSESFVVKLSSGGTRLWATFLGGSASDSAAAIAVDGSGRAFVAGTTNSTDFAGATNSGSDGSQNDAFAAMLDASGSAVWATYLGGSGDDHGTGIVVDSASDAFVTGFTSSSDFAGADNSYAGKVDAFAVKLDQTANEVWATYVGGTSSDDAAGIALDDDGNVLLAGETSSPSFPGATGNYDGGSDDGFVAEISEGTAPPPWLSAGAGAQYTLSGGVLTVTSGTVTFTADASSTDPNLHVVVQSGGAVEFQTTQHFEILELDGGTASFSTSPGGVLVVQAVFVSSGGGLNLKGNDLVVNYEGSSPLGTWSGMAYSGITGLIASGRDGGKWDGAGIVTSTTSGNVTTLGLAEASDVLGISGTQTALWDGQTVDSTSVLVKYTYGGDANLDGKINIDDYGRIDSHVGQSGAVFGWFNGDFNYDGKINIDDYGIIDSNIGAQGSPLTVESVADASLINNMGGAPMPRFVAGLAGISGAIAPSASPFQSSAIIGQAYGWDKNRGDDLISLVE